MNQVKSRIKATARISRMMVVICIIVLTSALPLPNTVQAAAGDLDPTFGISGKVTTDFSTNLDDAQAIMIQPDGKIIAAGTNGVDFALARYNIDGSLDLTFATNGKTTTDFFGVPEDRVFSIALQPDGKIIAAGRARSNINSTNPLGFAMARYNSDGSLDGSFGSGGKVYTQILGQQDVARAIAIQSDGKIVLAGSAVNSGSTFDLAVARYNSDGSLDSTFGVGGRLTINTGGGSGAFAVSTQSDGKIIVAGSFFNSVTGFDFALLRFNNDGVLDATFGNNGLTTTDFFNHPLDEAFAMAMQPDGKIILAGVTGDSGITFRDFALARYSPNGVLDSTFGNDGRVMTDFSGNLDIANGVAVQADGKIVAGGSINTFSIDSDFALARYNSNGSLDPFFGMGGKITVDFSGKLDQVSEVAIQSDGKIVVAGNSFNSGGIDSDFALARLEASGGVFNACLQDDSNGNLLQINTATGEYQFANCGDFGTSGAGQLAKKGCTITLQHNAADRRVLVKIDTCQKKATASVQIFSQGMTFSITDRNTTNNTCACGN